MTTQASSPDIIRKERELAEYDGDDRVVSSTEMRAEILLRPKPAVHFYSGLPGLDALMDGYQGGELIAVSGPTKNGKTLLAQTLTVNFAVRKIRTLWVSFEVPMPQFLQQIPETCEFFLPKILKPHNPSWIDDRILEAKLKNNIRAVFIDHLHYLIDMAKGGRNISIDIGQIIRGLKRAAVRHNIVIFLLCHSTKAMTPTGEPRELTAFDIRDSSFVPQEADSTVIVQRMMDKEKKDITGHYEYNNKALIKVCNHRRTGVMDKRTVVEKRGLLFEQWEDPNRPVDPKFYADSLAEKQVEEEDESLPF